MSEYKLKHGNPLTGRVMHECKICKVAIEHQMPTLIRHANVHGMTLWEYYGKFIRKSDCKIGQKKSPSKAKPKKRTAGPIKKATNKAIAASEKSKGSSSQLNVKDF